MIINGKSGRNEQSVRIADYPEQPFTFSHPNGPCSRTRDVSDG